MGTTATTTATTATWDAEAAAGEGAREYADRFAPAPTLADAHSQWHAINGRFAVCPLDCGASEAMLDEHYQEPELRISCGHCKGRHASVSEVRECATFHLGERDRRCF